MTIRYRSFAGRSIIDHGVSVRSDTSARSAGVIIAVGARRAMAASLTPEYARALAKELIAHADRLERPAEVRVIPIEAATTRVELERWNDMTEAYYRNW